jgi:hypothetical protein
VRPVRWLLVLLLGCRAPAEHPITRLPPRPAGAEILARGEAMLDPPVRLTWNVQGSAVELWVIKVGDGHRIVAVVAGKRQDLIFTQGECAAGARFAESDYQAHAAVVASCDASDGVHTYWLLRFDWAARVVDAEDSWQSSADTPRPAWLP